MSAYQFEHVGYLLSTDKSLLQLDVIHTFLANESYWPKDIPKSIVAKSMSNSLCFGVYANGVQVAFARVISDFATFGYLWLMEKVMQHPDLQHLRRFALGTRDAHELYRKFGFREPDNACNNMEIRVVDIYTKMKEENAG